MQFSTIAGAAVLLALSPFASAVGSASVVNNCGFPVYYASVAQNAGAGMQALQGTFSESFTLPNVGVSIKLAPNNTLGGPITQFEYTWSAGKVAYDISNINGNPFASFGMEIVPSMQNDPSNPTCQTVACPAGQSSCSAAYNQPDDVRTMVCSENANLVMTLCPGGASKRSEDMHAHQRVHARHIPKRA